MKLSVNARRTREIAKSLKIVINSLEIETKEENSTSVLKIEAKEEDFTIAKAKGIVFLFQAFYMYMQIFVFLAASGNKLLLQLALSRYTEYLMML